MKTIYIIFVVSAVCVLQGASAKTMSLAECLDSAAVYNPQLKAREMAVEKTRLLTATAFDAPNTGIELAQNATEGGGMDNGLQFSQEFDFPTVYVARRRVLKADTEVASSELSVARNSLFGEIAAAYHNLVYLKCLCRIYADRLRYYSEFARIAAERQEAGESSRIERINAERLRDNAGLESAAASGRYATAASSLASLIGMAGTVEPVEDEPVVLEYGDILEQPEIGFTAMGRLLESQIRKTEKDVFLAKQEFMPGLSLSATSQLLIKGFNPYNIERHRFDKGNFMGFSVGVTVPLFFGAKLSRLKAAKRDVEIARMVREDEEKRLTREYEEARGELAESLGRLRYYEETGLGQAAELRRLAKVSYELGEIDYLEYMENLQAASEMEAGYLESINNYNQSVIRIKTLKSQYEKAD